jgi:hypothetical protein
MTGLVIDDGEPPNGRARRPIVLPQGWTAIDDRASVDARQARCGFARHGADRAELTAL